MTKLLRNRSKLFFVVCSVFALYLVATFGINAFDQRRLADDAREAERELLALHQTRSDLEAARKYAASDRFVEIEARRLGMVKANEIPFVIESPPPPKEQETPRKWWERLLPR